MAKEEAAVSEGNFAVESQNTSLENGGEGESKQKLSLRRPVVGFHRLYTYLEFTRGYKFVLFFLFGGTLFAFAIQRLSFLNYHKQLCPPVPSIVGRTALPDLCYWVTNFTRYKVGLMLHIASVLPACIFGVIQFLPIIRHKFILYHRIAGYIIFILLTASNIGFLMIADISSGGDLPTRTFLGFLALVISIMICMAIYNIKRLQIDQHRAWMLRIFIYTGFVITQRLLQVIIPLVLTRWPSIKKEAIMPCEELEWLYFGNTTKLYTNYPACHPDNIAAFAPLGNVLVEPELGSSSTTDWGRDAAAFNVAFSTAGFLAVVLHAIAVEIYITLTPKTARQLKEVSWKKQRERGWGNPGIMGLTVERLGDADPWAPGEESL